MSMPVTTLVASTSVGGVPMLGCAPTGQGVPTNLTCPAAPSTVTYPDAAEFPLVSGSCIYVPNSGADGLFLSIMVNPSNDATCDPDLYVVFTDPDGNTANVEFSQSGVYYTAAGSSSAVNPIQGTSWLTMTPPASSGLWISVDSSGTLNVGTNYWNDSNYTFFTQLITGATGFLPNGLSRVVVGPQGASSDPTAWSMETFSAQPYPNATSGAPCLASGWGPVGPSPTPTAANLSTPGSALITLQGYNMVQDHASTSCSTFFAPFQYTTSAPASVYLNSDLPNFILYTDTIAWNNPLSTLSGSQPWVAPTQAQITAAGGLMYLLINGDSVTIGLGASPSATTGVPLATFTAPGMSTAAYLMPTAVPINTSSYFFSLTGLDAATVSPYPCAPPAQAAGAAVTVPGLNQSTKEGWLVTGTALVLAPANPPAVCSSGWPWSLSIAFSNPNDTTTPAGGGVLTIYGPSVASYQPQGGGSVIPLTASSSAQLPAAGGATFVALDGTTGDLFVGCGSAPSSSNVAFQVPSASAPSTATTVQVAQLAAGASGIGLVLNPSSVAPWPTPPAPCAGSGSSAVAAHGPLNFPTSQPAGSTYSGTLTLQSLAPSCSTASMTLVFYGSSGTVALGAIQFTSASSLVWTQSGDSFASPANTTTQTISPAIAVASNGASYSWSMDTTNGTFSIWSGTPPSLGSTTRTLVGTAAETPLAQFSPPWASGGSVTSIGSPAIIAEGSSYAFTLGTPTATPPPATGPCTGATAVVPATGPFNLPTSSVSLYARGSGNYKIDSGNSAGINSGGSNNSVRSNNDNNNNNNDYIRNARTARATNSASNVAVFAGDVAGSAAAATTSTGYFGSITVTAVAGASACTVNDALIQFSSASGTVLGSLVFGSASSNAITTIGLAEGGSITPPSSSITTLASPLASGSVISWYIPTNDTYLAILSGGSGPPASVLATFTPSWLSSVASVSTPEIPAYQSANSLTLGTPTAATSGQTECPSAAAAPSQAARSFPTGQTGQKGVYGSATVTQLQGAGSCSQNVAALSFYSDVAGSSLLGALAFSGNDFAIDTLSNASGSGSTLTPGTPSIAISPPLQTGQVFSWYYNPGTVTPASPPSIELYSGSQGPASSSAIVLATLSPTWLSSMTPPLSVGAAAGTAGISANYIALTSAPQAYVPATLPCNGSAVAAGNPVTLPWVNASAFSLSLSVIDAACTSITDSAAVAFTATAGSPVATMWLQSPSIVEWKDAVSNSTGTISLNPPVAMPTTSSNPTQLWISLASGVVTLGTGSVPLASSTTLGSGSVPWASSASRVATQAVLAGYGGYAFAQIQTPVQVPSNPPPHPKPSSNWIARIEAWWKSAKMTTRVLVGVGIALAVLVVAAIVFFVARSLSRKRANRLLQQERYQSSVVQARRILADRGIQANPASPSTLAVGGGGNSGATSFSSSSSLPLVNLA